MWNYRIISKSRDGETFYALTEVYYNSDRDESPGTYSYTEPDLGWFEDPQEIIDSLRLMLNDAELDRPVLDTNWDKSWTWVALPGLPTTPVYNAEKE